MPISISCGCGSSYNVKDELRGKSVRCPQCNNVLVVGGIPTLSNPVTTGDPRFARHKFLLHQKHLAISEKYVIWDDHGQELFFVERPVHMFRSLLAILGGLICTGAVAYGLVMLGNLLKLKEAGPFFVIGGVFLGLGTLLFTIIALYPRRHVTIYTDSSKSQPLVKVFQKEKFVFLNAHYHVTLPSGTLLAVLSKNYLYDIFRKKWTVTQPDGGVWVVAKEDSIILSLLRRFLGPLFGMLRTNYVFLRGTTDQEIGQFNRKFTLLDKYVLDLSADPNYEFDRRVALALGIMLDTGEKR